MILFTSIINVEIIFGSKPLKFISIRQKLITRVSLIFLFSFTVVLSLIAYFSTNQSSKALAKSEQSIRATLQDKGTLLIKNNSQALMGMVNDNAFSAVQDLVSNTVKDDIDMIYGIYMEVDKRPWVYATPDNPSGSVNPGEVLQDETSRWASNITEQASKIMSFKGVEVYEFAAPIKDDDEIMGFLRYGFSTERMQNSLAEEADLSQQSLIQTMGVLIVVGLLAIIVGFTATRKVAKRITEPLNQLTDAAETIATGDYSSEVLVASNDEIGTLANNFETMRSTINKKMSDLATLNAIGESLAAILDKNQALQEVLHTMHKHSKVKKGAIFLANEDGDMVISSLYPPQSMALDEIKRRDVISCNITERVFGQAIQQKETVFVADTAKEPDYLKSSDNQSPRAILSIPLIDKNNVVGVMNFSGLVNEMNFEKSDFEFASSVARLLVITIKNIRMRQVIEEQNRTLEQKVEQRTQALQEKTNDIMNMMQNMHQGLFTIMEGGVIHHEYAAYLEEILDTNQIAGRNFMDLLFSGSNLGVDRLNQVQTAVEALLGSDEMMFEFNAHLLAAEIVVDIDGGQQKILELDWDPIILAGEIDKIMVTVRDVTALKALQAEAEEQKRELEIIGHILSIERTKFNEFIQSSFDFINECKTIIQSTPEKNLDVVSVLFRNMHTVKGNARTYGFSYITNSIHNVENSYDEIRKNGLPWDPEKLLYELKIAEYDIQRYVNIAREKLEHGVIEQDKLSTSLDQRRIHNLLKSIQDLDLLNIPNNVKNCLKETYQMLIAFDAKPIDQAIQPVLQSAESISSELNKPVPKVALNGDGIYIKSSANGMLNDIFMHVFRNAIDHGIEEPHVRVNKGKEEEGTIQLNAVQRDGYVEFAIKDDGKGLAINHLYEKAVSDGLFEKNQSRPSASEIANLIFASGFSTAQKVSEVSGRGVGMDAVKTFVEREGGSIHVALDEGEEMDDYRTFTTKIKLPEKFCVISPDFELA